LPPRPAAEDENENEKEEAQEKMLGEKGRISGKTCKAKTQ
jgi:hypothetical protein